MNLSSELLNNIIDVTSKSAVACYSFIGKNEKILADKASTDVMLIHGDTDQVVSPNFMLEAKDFFERNNLKIDTHLVKNCGHHIPIEASSIALNYISKKIL